VQIKAPPAKKGAKAKVNAPVPVPVSVPSESIEEVKNESAGKRYNTRARKPQ
jgi:hypothetical protein